MENKNGSRKGLIASITLLIVIYVGLQNMDAVVSGIQFLWRICLPVTVGGCVAFVLNVLMSYLEEKPLGAMGKSRKKWVRSMVRPLALILTLLLALGTLMTVILVVLPRLQETVELLVKVLPEYIESMAAWLTDMLTRFKMPEDYINNLTVNMKNIGNTLLNFLEKESSMVAGVAVNAAMSVVDLASNMLLGLVIAIYTLLSKEKIGRIVGRTCKAFLPEKVNDQVQDIGKVAFETFSNFVRGQITEALILGILCYLGMLLFRFPHAAVISLLIGVTALVPIAGAWIGGAVGAFLILIVDPIRALWFVVYLLVLQQLEGNLIYPRVVGATMGLPGLIVISAVIIGGNIGGVVGMLIGVPLAAVGYELLKRGIMAGLKRRKIQEE